jgi:hypothetical protein
MVFMELSAGAFYVAIVARRVSTKIYSFHEDIFHCSEEQFPLREGLMLSGVRFSDIPKIPVKRKRR